jgi:hypothetical protein
MATEGNNMIIAAIALMMKQNVAAVKSKRRMLNHLRLGMCHVSQAVVLCYFPRRL